MTKKFTSIVLAGEPNSGKSTLLNQLIGEKLSIVCHKAQTTRKTITGIFIHNDCQVLIYDTPGIFDKPTSLLERKIVRNARNTINDNDQIYLVIDSSQVSAVNVVQLIEKVNKPNVYLLLNKIDVTDSEKIDALTKSVAEKAKKIFQISALTGLGIDELKSFIYENAEISEWLYPEDEITTIPERELAADITREKLFFAAHQELPYALAVETELWKEDKTKNLINISQVIYTKREAHKKIIIGKGGINIKNIGMQARKELEAIVGCQVNLKLFVKVRPDWDKFDII